MSYIATAEVSVFVTTYRVGNTKGFAHGKWFDLSDYADKDDFLEQATEFAIEELHDNDPELAFSDYNFSHDLFDDLLSEDAVNELIWGYLELDEFDLQLAESYLDAFDESATDYYDADDLMSRVRETYEGEFSSKEEFAKHVLQAQGYLTQIEDLPHYAKSAIDFDEIGENLMDTFSESNDYYFRSYY